MFFPDDARLSRRREELALNLARLAFCLCNLLVALPDVARQAQEREVEAAGERIVFGFKGTEFTVHFGAALRDEGSLRRFFAGR